MLSLVARCFIPLYNLEHLARHVYPMYDDFRLGKTKPVDNSEFCPKLDKVFNVREGYQNARIISPVDLVAAPIGNSFFHFSPKVVLLDAGVKKIDPNASKLFLKYSVAQVKNKDALIKYGVLLTISVAAAIFLPTFYLAVGVSLVAHALFNNLIGRMQAANAYSSALKSATVEEKSGAYRYLKAADDFQDEQVAKSNLLKINYLFELLFPCHPSTPWLLNETKKSLRNNRIKKEEIDNYGKDDKYLALKEYLRIRSSLSVNIQAVKLEVRTIAERVNPK